MTHLRETLAFTELVQLCHRGTCVITVLTVMPTWHMCKNVDFKRYFTVMPCLEVYL